jgi:hypothetical protein
LKQTENLFSPLIALIALMTLMRGSQHSAFSPFAFFVGRGILAALKQTETSRSPDSSDAPMPR